MLTIHVSLGLTIVLATVGKILIFSYGLTKREIVSVLQLTVARNPCLIVGS